MRSNVGMRAAAVTTSDLDHFLRSFPQWVVEDDHLVRTVGAPDFLTGIAWVSAVASRAEVMHHHPDIDIRWRTITFRLVTHEVGAITERDLALATQIEQVVSDRG